MSVPTKILEKFELFKGVSPSTISFLSERGVVREFYRKAIVTDGYLGKLILVNRGIIGVATLFITPYNRPLTSSDLEKVDYIPIVSIYSKGKVCVEPFLTRNPNIYVESLTDNTEVIFFDWEDVWFVIRRDVIFVENLLAVCGETIATIAFISNSMKLPATDRIDAISSILPVLPPQEDLGRLCNLRRETVNRALRRRKVRSKLSSTKEQTNPL